MVFDVVDCSDDSAVQRRRIAASRLRDFGEEATSAPGEHLEAILFKEPSSCSRRERCAY